MSGAANWKPWADRSEYPPVVPSPPVPTFDPPASHAGSRATLALLLGRLLGAYESFAAAAGERDAHDAALDSLRLALAALRDVDAAAGGRPPQIAVIGPTQTGKSTVVNLLLGQRVAEVSPLAGFTVHPQGFRIVARSDDEGWLAGLFPGAMRVATSELRRDDFAQYALTPVDTPPTATLLDATLPPCVVWDTPDFDSLASRTYAAGLLTTAALADVYLLVVSKEKYADRAVWRWLALCAPLRRPLVICLNKTTPESEAALAASLRERVEQLGGAWGDVPIITLAYDAQIVQRPPERPTEAITALRGLVCERLAAVAADAGRRRARGVGALVRANWDAWVAPLQAEDAARQAWNAMVDDAARLFLSAYRRDYLDHPERYDSFRRTALALLDLIELPAVGHVVGRVRQIVTWPARTALAAGYRLLNRRREDVPRHSLGVEAGVLVEAWSTLLAGLQRDVARRAAADAREARWWLALGQALDAQGAFLRSTFEAAIETHHRQVAQEIDAAARSMFEMLRRDPTRLAVARTLRAGMDVGSILLAIKTGGLSMLDAVWAPAAFAAGSLLLEGAANLDLQRANAELKRRQLDAVRRVLVPEALARPLRAVVDELAGPGLFNVSPADVEAALRAVDALEAGDA